MKDKFLATFWMVFGVGIPFTIWSFCYCAVVLIPWALGLAELSFDVSLALVSGVMSAPTAIGLCLVRPFTPFLDNTTVPSTSSTLVKIFSSAMSIVAFLVYKTKCWVMSPSFRYTFTAMNIGLWLLISEHFSFVYDEDVVEKAQTLSIFLFVLFAGLTIAQRIIERDPKSPTLIRAKK